MFKHLVPVVALALLAGPAFAAGQAPATTPGADQPAKSSTSKHHKHSSKSSKSKKSATSDSSAPAK